jgi:hypothetical protein
MPLAVPRAMWIRFAKSISSVAVHITDEYKNLRDTPSFFSVN